MSMEHAAAGQLRLDRGGALKVLGRARESAASADASKDSEGMPPASRFSARSRPAPGYSWGEDLMNVLMSAPLTRSAEQAAP